MFARLHCIGRRTLQNQFYCHRRDMRPSVASVLSVLASTAAFVPKAPLLSSRTTTIVGSPRDFSKPITRHLATVAPENIDTPALTPSGASIAEGHVVKTFGGGLIAVQVDDDKIDPSGKGGDSSEKDGGSSSLGGDLIGRQVVFSNGEAGVVVTHRPPIVFVYTDMENSKGVEGEVKVMDSLASVDVSEGNSVVDCFGRPTAGSSSESFSARPIFASIPKVSDIALINSPLVTGVTMFDALAPIGKGQNMLMISHDIADMRKYVGDMLSIQKDKVKCIYAATGESQEVEQMLTKAGLSEDVVLVSSRGGSESADKTSAAAEATVTAATACSLAEAFALEKGMDTFVIIDNIDQHKSLWDATTRVLVDVFGVDAVVKGDRDGGASSEMRAFFSSLVQRSAQFNKKLGGGSVTLLLLSTIPQMEEAGEDTEFTPEDFAGSPQKVQDRIDMLVQRKVPLTTANLRKIQIPIPSDKEGSRRLALQHIDDLISMSDGQIWLDEELEQSGRRPAMDFQRSITRIGIGADTESRADAPAMRRVVEGLRLDLSQADDMDGADVGTKASKAQIRNALAWLLAMHQPSASGARRLSESCVALLAAAEGYLGDSIDAGKTAGTSEGQLVVEELLAHVSKAVPAAMETIDATGDLTDEAREEIETAIKAFFS